jgi:hypothetical protein
VFIVLVLLFIFICYKWGDWKNWQSYYSTILFFIACDYIETFVSAAKPLWHYTATIFPGAVTHMIISLVIYPCTVLIFFSFYHNFSQLNKFLYLILWVGIYSLLEYIGLKFNFIVYFNGWNFIYSVFFDLIMFFILVVHQKSPPISWLLSLTMGITITWWFKLPPTY